MMKVQRILTGPMDLRVSVNKDGFSIQFSDISTSAFVSVKDWGKNSDGDAQSLVLISSPILREIKPTPALFEGVARQGGSRWFGHVEAVDSTVTGLVDLWMSHTLLGDYLDEQELRTGVYGVLSGADDWDDELQKRFGGKRWIDR
jgi:hypothetical protein